MTGRRVRARRQPDGPVPPLKLARFSREDWPAGLSAERAVMAWWRISERWCAEHGYTDGGSVLGNPLARMIARREARLATVAGAAWRAGR